MQTVIKEKPILFSTSMVKAILEGRKTQTRRIIPICKSPTWARYLDWEMKQADHPLLTRILEQYYQPGQRLWVRETLQKSLTGTPIRYKADGCPVMHEGESANLSDWNYRYNILVSIP